MAGSGDVLETIRKLDRVEWFGICLRGRQEVETMTRRIQVKFRTEVRARLTGNNHNQQPVKVRTKVRAGLAGANHNHTAVG